MVYLKQSTAADVVLGPFVDDADGKTTEEGLTLSQGDLYLSKNASTAAQKNDASSATHLYGGNYKVPLDTTDTNTLGRLTLMCKEAGALPISKDFMVIPANVYDSMVSGSEWLTVDAMKPDWSVSGTTLTVKKPDDATTAYTKTLTTDAGADPITGAT
jgi:hypothetical protein